MSFLGDGNKQGRPCALGGTPMSALERRMPAEKGALTVTPACGSAHGFSSSRTRILSSSSSWMVEFTSPLHGC